MSILALPSGPLVHAIGDIHSREGKIGSRRVLRASIARPGPSSGETPIPTTTVSRRSGALGQFASPYFVASALAALNVHPRTPRAARALAPRLARNLSQCRAGHALTSPGVRAKD